jgi:HEAT repeat protein
VKGLAAALFDTEPEVRAAAATALGRIGPEARSAVPGLEALSGDGNEAVRKAAEAALAAIGG